MNKREVTGKVVDEIIRFGSLTATVGAMMLAPNILIALDKPLKKIYTHLDDKERAREVRRVIYYMKERGYLAGDYEHGLQLTEKARIRLERTDTEKLIAQPQKVWDRIWRIVLYDIPDTATAGRKAFQSELRRYGFFQLQRSVLITPFPCQKDVESIAARCGVDKYVTFFESNKLANSKPLIARFRKKYPETKF